MAETGCCNWCKTEDVELFAYNKDKLCRYCRATVTGYGRSGSFFGLSPAFSALEKILKEKSEPKRDCSTCENEQMGLDHYPCNNCCTGVTVPDYWKPKEPNNGNKTKAKVAK